ncbi:hypothetical protein LY78DRAFT_662701 [Colletotrichum sublineola]|nr:hypothetical protein LY78DRAFT_662701 [Colletotrichum sublineola]
MTKWSSQDNASIWRARRVVIMSDGVNNTQCGIRLRPASVSRKSDCITFPDGLMIPGDGLFIGLNQTGIITSGIPLLPGFCLSLVVCFMLTRPEECRLRPLFPWDIRPAEIDQRRRRAKAGFHANCHPRYDSYHT